jgi:hypothetical protein
MPSSAHVVTGFQLGSNHTENTALPNIIRLFFDVSVFTSRYLATAPSPAFSHMSQYVFIYEVFISHNQISTDIIEC